MTGLLKNNFYASIANIRIFLAAMATFGFAVICLDNDSRTLLLIYMLVSMAGFPANAIASMRKERSSKWYKYKLTFPVERKVIIGSYFLSQLIWLAVGMLFAGVCVSSSILVHGFPFDRNIDILMVFIAGISASLFMGAVFYPLFYWGGDEKNEVIFMMSFACSAIIIAGLSGVINYILGMKPTTAEVVTGAVVMLGISAIVFVLSYFLTVRIFSKKEY